MPTITGIVPSVDRPGYVVILVDGAPFATVPASAVDRLSLGEGDDAASASALAPMDKETQGVYERALNLLSYRARSAKDMTRKLIEKGATAGQSAAAVARLVANGLLDDPKYAESVARSKMVGGARSSRRVKQDLARKGVDASTAAAAVARVLTDEGTSDLAQAERAAAKKARTLARLDPPERRKKLYAFLARQGFAFDVVKRAVEKLEGRARDEDAEIVDDDPNETG
jgi:regulatory protein